MKKKLVLIGGGTGSFTLLSGLKKYPFDITALVNMADNGGSSGVLRDEMGVLPPGDVRQCLIALSDSPQILRDLFNYRFPKGTSFAGHSFGNLFLSAFEDMTGDFTKAVELAEQVLHINGRVLPITTDNCHLCIETSAGTLSGEQAITAMRMEPFERPRLSLSPKAKISPAASMAIKQADVIVIAPGNLYSSIAPALLVDGMKSALATSSAKKIYVCNLVNKPGQTDDFYAHDYVAEVERLVNLKFIDILLYNEGLASNSLREKYSSQNESPVLFDEQVMKNQTYECIGENLLAEASRKQNRNDTLIKRSLIRHDQTKIADSIYKLVE